MRSLIDIFCSFNIEVNESTTLREVTSATDIPDPRLIVNRPETPTIFRTSMAELQVASNRLPNFRSDSNCSPVFSKPVKIASLACCAMSSDTFPVSKVLHPNWYDVLYAYQSLSSLVKKNL